MTQLALLRTLAEVVDVVRDHESIHLRHSKRPEDDLSNGVSRDCEADVALPGLSVTVVTPEPWWHAAHRGSGARRLCKYAELGAATDRFPWPLTGRSVGNDPDHEPLVDRLRPVARVADQAIHEAVHLYPERFSAGEDSRGG